MAESIRVLSKQIFPYLEILLIIQTKIYYLKIKEYNDFFIIEQTYLLEEIPNKKDLIQRVNYYVGNEQYKYNNKETSNQYIKKIGDFIKLFLYQMDQSQLQHFEGLYDGDYHPDLIDLSQLI